jgi:hypothetical protein
MHTCLSCKRQTRYNRRGCCAACYDRYRHMVQCQEITWDALEAAGLTRQRQNMTAEWRARWALQNAPISHENRAIDPALPR